MSKKHSPGPVPPGNQSPAGTGFSADADDNQNDTGEDNAGAAFQEQDPKRRLGNFEGTGEHSRQQPGRLNDGDTHSQ